MTTNTVAAEQPFGKIRSFIWPIHNYELKKLLPMLFMFFFISFNYSVVRNLKDALVVNAAGSPGASIIPYLKLWVVTPSAIVFMVLFAKLSNILNKRSLFYVSTSVFIVFFSIFLLVLYPARDFLHFPDLAVSFLPDGFVAIARIWTFSLFYVFAELWGSVMLSLMFWGFANDTTRVSESKRFYALFGIGANVALEVAGRATGYFAGTAAAVPAGVDPMQVTLTSLISLFLAAATLVMVIYWWINRYVLTDPRFFDPTQVKKKKSKPKMSLGESFKFLIQSKYLGYIAILVIAYGISINMIEVSWKEKLKIMFAGDKNAYLAFMGTYSTYVARTTIFMMLFVTSNVLRRFGWACAAYITPVVLLISGAFFFTIVIGESFFDNMFLEMGTTALVAAVMVGTFQNVISKSAKYSLFDPTKEMTYIPLDQESKTKGKAAIDVVGARLGKAGGSLIQQGLFLIGPLAVVTPYIAGIVGIILIGWIYAVGKLSKEFNKISNDDHVG